MNDSRRRFLGASVTVLVGPSISFVAGAAGPDDYPNKPIKIVVPWGAGTVVDIRMRLISDRMAKALGQPVIVENRPGAGATIGADYVAKARPDGYTLLAGSIADLAVAPAVHPKLPYDPRKDFAPITQYGINFPLLVVNPSLNVKSMEELIALAKAKPGQLTFATYGNGTLTHLLLAQLNQLVGIDLTHVPYKNAANGLTDVVGGQVSMMFDYYTTSGGFIKEGKLRPLMVVSDHRLAVLPEVSTVAEAGLPRLLHPAWAGLLAPVGTPPEIIQRLNTEFVKAFQSPEFVQHFEGAGGRVKTNTPEEFAAFIRSEQESLAAIAKATGARPD